MIRTDTHAAVNMIRTDTHAAVNMIRTDTHAAVNMISTDTHARTHARFTGHPIEPSLSSAWNIEQADM